ncbi:MAG: Ig-like domain repeat protein [Acidobacteriota bacterium]
MFVRGPDGRFDQLTGRIIPELTLSSGNTSYLFVDPADAAIIYDTPNKVLNPGFNGNPYDGTGVSIGIVGVSDLASEDVLNYRMAFLGESTASANLPTVIVDGNDPGLNGAGTEALLDNEIAGGIAPKAKVYFYTSADTDLSSGVMNALFRALDDNTVSILNLSFSSCEAAEGASGNQIILEASEQAAAQGITLTVSAGDNGSAGCDDFNTQAQATHGFGVNSLASTPYAVAVGGTDFDTLSTSFATYVNNTASGVAPYYATALKYIPENPWNDSTTVNTRYSNNVPLQNSQGTGNIVAGGGGASSVYAKPSFQSSLTPQDGSRDLPDLSFLAGNGLYSAAWVLCSDNVTDGVTSQSYTECQTANGQFTSSTVFGGVGGTSAAAPAFAGMLALVAQAHGSASDNYRLGQADDILYQLAQSKYSTVFHDVTTGNNSVPCMVGSPDCGANNFLTGYNAGTKYDFASGLGSVDVAALVNNWSSVALSSTSTTLKIDGSTAAYTGVHGQSLTFDVNVTPASAIGTVGIVDNASGAGGVQNNGQFAIPISGGAGSASYNGLPGGSYTVWARYGGDTANASSTSTPSIDVTITPEASTTTLSVQAYDATGKQISITNIPFGSYVIADAKITGTAEGAATQGVATGSVTFTDGAKTLGKTPVSSGNLASWPPTSSSTPMTGGQHQLVASYSGDASYNASTSHAVSFTIVPAQTSTTVQTTSSTVSSTQSANILFDIYSPYFPGVPPTGSASLMLNNTVLATTSSLASAETGNPGSYQWDTFGGFVLQASQLQPGVNTLTVAYSGDSNYGPSSGTVAVDAIAPGGGVTLTTPASVTLSTASNDSSTSTVTLTSSGGYTGWISWGCYVTPNTTPLNCWIPETHVPQSSSVDTLMVLSGNAPAGTYTLNIDGTDNTTDGVDIVKTVQITIGSAATPGLAVMNNGPLTVSAGASTGNTSNVSIVGSGGFTGQVNLACTVTTSISNPQSPPTCSVSSSVTLNGSTPAVAQVKVSTTPSTTAGNYNVAVTAMSASTSTVSTTDSVPLTITASPSYALTSSGFVTIGVGTVNPSAATVTIISVNGFSGSLQLRCFADSTFGGFGFTLPTCSVPSTVQLSSGSPATVNVSLGTAATTRMGFYLMTITAFDPNSQVGFDTSVDVVVAPPPTFTLSNSGTIQVIAGATSGNTGTISVTSANGFTGNVNLGCSVSTTMVGARDTPGCSLNPTAVNVNGTTASTSTLSVSTTGATNGTAIPSLKRFSLGSAIPVLAFVFLFGIRSKRRTWVRMLSSLLLILCMGTVACGGGGGGGGGSGSGGSGTTPGNYSVKVTATDAATGKISAQTSVTLTVN